jgi:hypothetical protein
MRSSKTPLSIGQLLSKSIRYGYAGLWIRFQGSDYHGLHVLCYQHVDLWALVQLSKQLRQQLQIGAGFSYGGEGGAVLMAVLRVLQDSQSAHLQVPHLREQRIRPRHFSGFL